MPRLSKAFFTIRLSAVLQRPLQTSRIYQKRGGAEEMQVLPSCVPHEYHSKSDVYRGMWEKNVCGNEAIEGFGNGDK